MKARKSRSAKSPEPPAPNFGHVDRIAQKMRHGSSETAEYATVVYGTLLQSERAKKPRPNALTGLILDILRQDMTLSTPQVLARLRTMVGLGVIEAIDDETIDWIDHRGGARITNVSALEDRVARAKKAIRDSG